MHPNCISAGDLKSSRSNFNWEKPTDVLGWDLCNWHGGRVGKHYSKLDIFVINQAAFKALRSAMTNSIFALEYRISKFFNGVDNTAHICTASLCKVVSRKTKKRTRKGSATRLEKSIPSAQPPHIFLLPQVKNARSEKLHRPELGQQEQLD